MCRHWPARKWSYIEDGMPPSIVTIIVDSFLAARMNRAARHQTIRMSPFVPAHPFGMNHGAFGVRPCVPWLSIEYDCKALHWCGWHWLYVNKHLLMVAHLYTTLYRWLLRACTYMLNQRMRTYTLASIAQLVLSLIDPCFIHHLEKDTLLNWLISSNCMTVLDRHQLEHRD